MSKQAQLLPTQYGPGELLSDDGTGTGVWVYVAFKEGFHWRVGYCAHGCYGHDSPEDACVHFKEWLVDTAVFRDDSGVKKPCSECALPTSGYAAVEFFGWEFALCDEHLHPMVLFDKIGDVRGLYG